MNEVKTTSNTAILFGIITLILQSTVQAESSVELDIGELEYSSFCVSCHGSDGKGKGPESSQLSAKPTDLTLLCKLNGGSFPETAVYNIIDGRRVGDFHGQEMPIWGEHFKEIEGNEEVVDERINNLIEHLKSIQVE